MDSPYNYSANNSSRRSLMRKVLTTVSIMLGALLCITSVSYLINGNNPQKVSSDFVTLIMKRNANASYNAASPGFRKAEKLSDWKLSVEDMATRLGGKPLKFDGIRDDDRGKAVIYRVALPEGNFVVRVYLIKHNFKYMVDTIELLPDRYVD